MTMSFGFASAWFGQEIKNPKFICRRRQPEKTRVQERSSPNKIILQTFDVPPEGHKRADASSTSPFCIKKKIKNSFLFDWCDPF
jgi:hypothetical protein